VEKITDLKQKIQSAPTGDDLVQVVLFRSNQRKIPKSQTFMHITFYQLKKMQPELFSDFIFNESGITPFSEELDSILFRLEASMTLPIAHPGYQSYNLEPSAETDRIYGKFAGQKEKIDACAEFFAECVKREYHANEKND
jgi:hypothetical protein